jgi:hypothetical protein
MPATTKRRQAARSQEPIKADAQKKNPGVEAKTTHLGPPEMTTDVAEPEPPRRGRGRGRPKKATTVGEHTDNVAQEAATLGAKTGKRVQDPATSAGVVEDHPPQRRVR